MASPGPPRIQVRIPVRVRVTVGLAATAVVAVVSGCATVPSSGAPQEVNTGANQVQAYEQPLPGPGPQAYRHQPPYETVLAFLHASASYAFDPAAAKQFLLPPLRKTWHPGPVIVVSSNIKNQQTQPQPRSRYDASSQGGPTKAVELTGQRLATLSQTGQYQYSPRTSTYQFVLQKFEGVWLIAELPSQDSLLLTQPDFEHVYQARSLYFFPLPFSPGSSYLVPDPVYAPLWNADSALNTNLASGLVKGLLSVQPGWLRGAAATAFPARTKLLGVSISGQTAVVNLGGSALHATADQRQGMAEQLEATLGSAAYSPALARFVQLEINGRTVESPKSAIAPIEPAPTGSLVYESSPGSVSKGLGRPASLGPAEFGSAVITAIAMAPAGPYSPPQEGAVAVAVTDGKDCAVYKQSTVTGPPTGSYRRVSLAASGGSCTSLSWDSNGNLWAAAGRKIWVLPAQSRRWQAVALPAHLASRGQPVPQILALRMAPDAVRAALLIKSGSRSRLMLAAVQEDGDHRLSLGSAVAAGTGLVNPKAVSWFSPYDLMVLDKAGIAEVPLTGGAAQQLSYAPGGATSLTTDGVTVVVGTADHQIQVSRPMASVPTTIIWRKPVIGALPAYPG